MTVYFEEEGKTSLPVDGEKLAKTAVAEALSSLACPYEAEVNVLLTDNEEIRKMNQEFRGIDTPTDVLSFPMSDYEIPGDFSCIQEVEDCFEPDTGELLLGDIVISKEKVIEQAENYGHSVEREFAFLIIHSVLHLIGYDHMEESERIRMEELQEQILTALRIIR